jgi:hypothetical protein
MTAPGVAECVMRTVDTLGDAVAPTVQRFLTGDLC